MQSRVEELALRLERVERRERKLWVALVAALALSFGCGAATVTAQYKRVNSHEIAIFGPDEKGEVLLMSRAADGGKLVIADRAGKPRIEMTADGIEVKSASGDVTWSSGGVEKAKQ